MIGSLEYDGELKNDEALRPHLLVLLSRDGIINFLCVAAVA